MKNYFSAQELDDLHLSSLPSCKRLINIRAKKENWPFRARKGKGGGKEYNINDLPSDVKAEILKNQQFKDNTIQQIRQEEALEAYYQACLAVKAKYPKPEENESQDNV